MSMTSTMVCPPLKTKVSDSQVTPMPRQKSVSKAQIDPVQQRASIQRLHQRKVKHVESLPSASPKRRIDRQRHCTYNVCSYTYDKILV